MTLFGDDERAPDFDGDTYDADRDRTRLQRQLNAVRDLMADGEWRVLSQIANAVGAPESSTSARLRDLRKPRFGGYRVERRYIGNGLFAYRVSTEAS